MLKKELGLKFLKLSTLCNIKGKSKKRIIIFKTRRPGSPKFLISKVGTLHLNVIKREFYKSVKQYFQCYMLGLETAKMTYLGDEHFLLAEKLRQEDPDQFYILVRMHLSFVLDLNTDECDNNLEKKSKVVKWSLPFSKKQKLGSKNNFEGTVLTQDFITQTQPIIAFLSKEENISQEGIFRRSGRVTRQQELKLLLQQGTELNFNSGQYSVHECATVLKNILSELPESVLTDGHYPAYCQIAELYGVKNSANKERLLTSIQLLMLLLPPENKKFFQEIIQLLHTAVSHQDKNRMSAENLATLFTPHLLCPRKLSPEALHTNSQTMCSVLAFMIEKGSELFEIPLTVAIDVKAYWEKKEKRKLSPLKQMNESVCDGTAVNTVFSFVDRERTAQEHQANPTETALAQLYAYIQSLPESSKKRKLIKQFNKENGYGTPLTVAGKKRIKALNLGDSIKKHLTGLGKTTKRIVYHESAEEEEFPQSEESLPSLKKPATSVADKRLKENRIPHKKSGLNKNSTSNNNNNTKASNKSGTLFISFEEDEPSRVKNLPKRKNKSCENIRNSGKTSKDELSYGSKESLQKSQASEPAIEVSRKRNSYSPVNISPSKSPRISDERAVLTRREHQTLTVSNKTLETSQNFNKFQLSRNLFGSVQNLSTKDSKVVKEIEVFADDSYKTPRRAISDFNLCDTVPTTGIDKTFKTPVQKFNAPAFVQNTNSNGYFPSPNNTNKLPILYGPKNSFLMTTSTPASGNNCLPTPIVDKNNSMSPITKSTKRMPKAMQETMMTPRSRKPVISLSSTDLCNLANTDSLESEDSYDSKHMYHQGKRLILEDSRIESGNDSLSSTFRNYLFSRSVLSASPVDLSFSSRTDDFLSLSEQNLSEENENFESLPEILNGAEFTESLLYCLDGNDPAASSLGTDDGEKLSHSSCSFSDCDKNLHRVYETAL